MATEEGTHMTIKSMKIYILLRMIMIAFLFVVLLCLWLKLRPPLWYFNLMITPHELPARLIEPAFNRITGLNLPSKTEEIRAIYQGGIEPRIFTQFKTNEEGVSYIKNIFTRIDGKKFEPIASYILRGTTVLDLFPIYKRWEKRFDTNMFDKEPIKSAIKCESLSLIDLNYQIIIDIDRNKVYIEAWYD
jgi:hypothetical protein